MNVFDDLSKREREILEIAYRLGEASARDIQEALNDGTSYSAVRTFLGNLEAKGRIGHRHKGLAYLWFPIGEPEKEGAATIASAVDTFFSGSRERAVAALLGTSAKPLSDAEYKALKALIDSAREKRG
jgi:predicted transcriptional regulator